MTPVAVPVAAPAAGPAGVRVFPIVPAPLGVLLVPVGVLAAVGVATWWAWRDPAAPAVARAVMAASLALTAAMLGAAVSGARVARAEVSPAGLRLRGDLWRRQIPAAELRAGDARVVDLGAERGLRPTVRTMGTGLPGYGAGWFRLADRSRAFLYLTDQRRVAYLPTTAGYAVLVSAADADGLVAAVRALPGAAR